MPDNPASGKGLSVPKNPALALRALNARHAPPVPQAQAESEAPNLSDRSEEDNTKLQTDKQTKQPTNQQDDTQSNRPSDQQTDQPTNRPEARAERVSFLPQPAQGSRSAAPAPAAPSSAEASWPPRVDGRTMRVRQETSDRTMVTSMRLAVATVEQLDEFCWRYRKRKQDVVQEALAFYFAAVAAKEGEEAA